MTRAYPGKASIFAGDTLTLHVSSDQPRFKVEIYRQGATLVLVHTTAWMTGYSFPEGDPANDWGWLGYNIPTSNAWQNGVYIAMIIEGDANGNEINRPDTATADARTSKALFVLKNPNPGNTACILYKLPFFTYHAYKAIHEGTILGSVYTGSPKISFLRPGGGTGGNPWDSVYPDEHDLATPRQTFAHWDAKFISWLERNNYKVDYCTDLDIHRNEGNFLSKYRLMLSVGHDEYWSDPMRNNVENFIRNKGNVAFFSGNTCWWRVYLEDADTAMRCAQSANDQWVNFKPENSLTGVSYANAGGWWSGFRDAVGYAVQYASHWIYNGTGLIEGQVFGDQERLVGYECDGCLFNAVAGNFVPTTVDGTPSNFLILGIGELLTNWQPGRTGSNFVATMGVYTNNGIVFTAATTDWARVLDAGNAEVDQITRNVLKHLKSKSVRIFGAGVTICSTHKPVEGATIKFHADISSLNGGAAALKYHWSATGGTPGINSSSVFELQIPSPPVPVTVSVFIDDGTDCPGFGTYTFIPYTVLEAAAMDFFCKLRMLIQHLSILVPGIGESKGPFVDPLYDPPKGDIMRILNFKQASSILKESNKLLKGLEEQLKGLKSRE